MAAPEKGLLGAHFKKWLALDGSDAKPINLDLIQQISVNGYVVIQAKSGRIIAVKPDADLASANAILQFGLKDGELKFFPISLSELSWSDEDVPSTKEGFLAALACAGDGQVTLGKFDPQCVLEDGQFKYLKIGFDGKVVCEDFNVGECPDIEAVEEFDSLWGCFDGQMVPMLPELGKTIIGEGDPVRWVKSDAVGNHVPVARTVVLSSHVALADNTALRTDDIDIAALPGYLAAYTFAMLTFKYYAASSTSHFIHDVAVDGRGYVGVACGTDFEVPYHYNSALVPIPDTKHWSITNTRSVWIPGSATGLHNLDIWIDGWVK
jgi:hypothetical protein